VDTPGYKAHDISFENQLREVIGRSDTLRLRSTDEKHFGAKKSAMKNLFPESFEQPGPSKSNGNNVDIDHEMMKLAENQIMYNALAQLMTKRGSTIRSAVIELPQQ
jgi:flagellar basal-body rod protein FlgB